MLGVCDALSSYWQVQTDTRQTKTSQVCCHQRHHSPLDQWTCRLGTLLWTKDPIHFTHTRTGTRKYKIVRHILISWLLWKKNHQVQFCCNRSCERYRLEGTRATRCDIVKQFEDFEADLNNRSQEIAHVSVLSLLSSSIFHPWDTGFIWLLCRPKVSKGGFTSRVVGFHQVHLRHTLGHHTYTNCQSTDWSSSLFVSFPPIAYLSYFHLWRWDKGWN